MQRFVKIILLVSSLLFSRSFFSQDIRGGYFEYKWSSGYTYSIKCTLILDSLALQTHTSVTINSNSVVLTSTASPGGKVFLYRYATTNTYSGPGNYNLNCNDSLRLSNIENIFNSQSKSMLLNSVLRIDAFSGPNSSPAITNVPMLTVTKGTPVVYNPGAFDSDGDSLSYSLVNCISSPAATYYLPSNSMINNLTGTFTYQADTVGIYAFRIRIQEWRKVSSSIQFMGNTELDFLVEVKAAVGIDELEKDNKIKIYPNPTSNILNIKSNFKNNSSVEIINYLGHTVLKQNYSESIDVYKLNPGYYFIKINNSYSKFIKE
ncbi:MAG TPA: T9SS type A sorting domain-containing protein [Bacteroidia bacterium]|nr:T9SS type A sorting domain-containing protein [Bacteroidia bacterium]